MYLVGLYTYYKNDTRTLQCEDVSLLGCEAEVLQSFEMLETTRPMIQCHISGDLHLQQHHSYNLKSVTNRYTDNKHGQVSENNSVLNTVTEYVNVFSWFV